MLLQNKSFLACNGLRYLSGSPSVNASFAFSSPANARSMLTGEVSAKRNRYVGEATMYKGDATPSGYTPTEGAWYPNSITGGMGSRYSIIGSGYISNSVLAGGLGGSVIMGGSGTIVTLPYGKVADHFIIDVVSLTSLGKISNTSVLKGIAEYRTTDNIVLNGQGTIPDVMLKILAWSISHIDGEGNLEAELELPMNLLAGLGGEGQIYATLVGLAYLLSNITGESITDADLQSIASLSSELDGQGTVADTVLKIIIWCAASISVEGNLEGTLNAPMALVASLLGTGNVTYASLVGLIYLLGNITGNGSINPNLRFSANLFSALEGEGSIPETLLKATAWCVSNIIGHGQMSSSSNLRGTSFMSANITSEGELVTPQSCAIAVWNAIAEAYNTPGTTGNKLNSAASAGDPWVTELPGSYVGNQAGKIMGTNIDQKISEIMAGLSEEEHDELMKITSIKKLLQILKEMSKV